MFGFIGIFLGPTLLAVGLTLVSHWVVLQNKRADEVV
jgi:predicted PurR-regulated permease PerM